MITDLISIQNQYKKIVADKNSHLYGEFRGQYSHNYECITEGAYFDDQFEGYFMVFSFTGSMGSYNYQMYLRDMGDYLDETTRNEIFQSAIDLISPAVIP